MVGGDSHCSTRVYQYQVLGLAYGPQECRAAFGESGAASSRPRIPGGGMPVRVLGTGIPAYCGGCPRCGAFPSVSPTSGGFVVAATFVVAWARRDFGAGLRQSPSEAAPL